MSNDTAHCELCESMMFGGSVVGDPRYFCGVCRECFKKVESDLAAAIARAERAEAALASCTIERDRARAGIHLCDHVISRRYCPSEEQREAALADEPEVKL